MSSSLRGNLMRTPRLPLALASLALVLAAMALAELPAVDPNDPPVDVQGHWTIYSKNIDDGETVEKSVEITQDHHHISGFFRGPNQEGKIHGIVNGQHIVFETQTKNVLTFRGRVDGNAISGLYGLHGRHAEFRAVRGAAGSR